MPDQESDRFSLDGYHERRWNEETLGQLGTLGRTLSSWLLKSSHG